MINKKKVDNRKKKDIFKKLNPKIVEVLSKSKLKEPTPIQEEAIGPILEGRNVLLISETGTGKTLAVMLPVFQSLLEKESEPIAVLYITPLKSLNRDLLDRLIWWANKLELEIAVRHGDTSPYARRQQVEFPPSALIVTLETLQPLLTGKKLRELLKNIKCVVIDECHEVSDSKRGIQLALGLQRLKKLCGDFQLIMLSATVGEPQKVASFFTGPKDVEIIKAVTPKQIDIRVISPKLTVKDGKIAKKIFTSRETAARLRTIMELIKQSRSTLTFTNTRDFAEILTSRIKTIDKKFPIAIHHSSLSKQVRIQAEKQFKEEKLKSIVCIPKDELVLTNDGLKKVIEVKVGEKILSYNVKNRKTIFGSISKKYQHTSNRLTKIEHEMGIIRVTTNHPILCFGRNGFEWKCAGNLQRDDILVMSGKINGNEILTLDLINFRNVFVDNLLVEKFGYRPICSNGGKGTRLSIVKKMMNNEELRSVDELYTKSGKKYYLPIFLTRDMGYIFGFKESDGREDLVLFNTNLLMLKKAKEIMNRISNRNPKIRPCSWDPSCHYIALCSRLLENLMNEMKKKVILLSDKVKYGILEGYLDGDGSLTIVNKRGKPWLKRIVFSTSSLEHKEYLLYILLSLGFKPKVHVYKKQNYYEIYLTYLDDKIKFLKNAKNSIKVSHFPSDVTLGIKPQTFYGLGPYLKQLRKSLGISTYLLEKNTSYSTFKHETKKRGITINHLKKINKYFKSQLLKDLVSHKFSLSRVRNVRKLKGKYNVVNFEVKNTDTFVVGGIITHNCTSSLQLGIDIGSVDLTIQYQSPRTVTQLVQRVGRSGHELERVSSGIIISTDEDDCFEAAVIARKALAGELEPVKLHSNSLDVLAHQLVGLTLEYWKLELPKAYQLIKAAWPYRNLSYNEFLSVCKQLQQLGLVFLNGYIKRKRRAFEYYFTQLSTIPDVKQYRIYNTLERSFVGVLDEEFVALHGDPGTTFIVKGEPWRIIAVEGDRLMVEPTDDIEAAVPGWEGELIPVPFEVAQEVGRLRKKIKNKLVKQSGQRKQSEREVAAEVKLQYPTDTNTAKKMVQVIKKQRKHSIVPDDKTILIEDYENIAIIHACFGSLVNQTLGRFITALLTARIGSVGLRTDPYRIILQFQQKNIELLKEVLLNTNPDYLQSYLEMSLTKSDLFEWKFVHVAKRFGAISREAEYGKTRMKRIIEDYVGTPIYKETLKELETEKLDIKKAVKILRKIQSGKIKLVFKPGLSPLGRIGIKHKYAEVVGPERPEREIFELFKDRLLKTKVRLVCLNCGEWTRTYTIKTMPKDVWCRKCEARLLGIVRPTYTEILKTIKKKLKRRKLSEEEKARYERVRKTADLYLVYRKPAAIALAGRGVGPATAKRILAKLHEKDDDLFRDILAAERVFIRTKKYWKI